MSKAVFSDLLRASPRRNRKSYFLLSLAGTVFGFVVMLPAFWLVDDLRPEHIEELRHSAIYWYMQVIPWLVGIPLTVINLIAAIQRCHDFNRSGWWMLLWFVPVVNFILFLVLFLYPGTHGPNRYGPDPREASPPA